MEHQVAPPATTVNNSGDGAATLQLQPPHINGGAAEMGDDGDRNSGGNRWPKQETLALIRIRSEMDAAFRDSNLKGPLWDNVSRKLLELGFNRSAKKCREKFENVYKYHRRTKEGRTAKSDKIYRFSDQLQALESNLSGAFAPTPISAATPASVLVAMSNNVNATGSDQNNVSPISVAAPAVMAVPPPPVMNHKRTFPFSQPNMSGSTNSASSSDTDDEPPRKKKKWEDFFGKLMKEVIQKQEELQMRFLDTLERREKDRVAREEAWRAQEILKMNQEYEMLVKERSVVAAKDAAIITFLQKLTEKNSDGVKLITNEAKAKLTELMAPPTPLPSVSTIQVLPQQQIQQTPPPPPPPPTKLTPRPPQPEVTPAALLPPVVQNLGSGGSAGENMLSPSPSRWPKAEIKALITLRTQLDIKYQENVPKGPLWEEISALMRNIGYNRNAKRCKEKWENINKYYKKLKESNKKRSENSKTCSYFDQLDAIYREKSNAIIVAQPENQWPPATVVQENTPAVQQPMPTTDTPGFGVKPEQQWRLPTVVKETPQVDDQGSDNVDDYDDIDDDGDDDDDDDDDNEDKDDESGGYEIVANKMSSMAAI